MPFICTKRASRRNQSQSNRSSGRYVREKGKRAEREGFGDERSRAEVRIPSALCPSSLRRRLTPLARQPTHVEVEVVILLAIGVLARDVDRDDDVLLALASRDPLRVVLLDARDDLGILPAGGGA
jgi:hypothetical protein